MAAEAKEAKEDPVYSDTDDEDEDFKEIDFEVKAPPKGRMGRKCSVMSASVKVSSDWEPPVHPKTEEEAAMLRHRVGKNVLMKHLSPREVNIMVAAFKATRFGSGDEIIKQGEEGDLFYVVEEGQCDITIDGVGVVAHIDGGGGRDYFGELALLYNAPRAATVTAVTPCLTWALDRTTFKTIMQDCATKQSNLYRAFLDKVPILSTLSAYEKMQLADALRATTYERDEIIIREGEDGNDFFIVEEGEVICTKRDGSGGEMEVSEPLGPGSYFGELALLNDDVRAATVRSVGLSRVLAVDRSTFNRIFGSLRDSLESNREMYEKYVDEKK